MFGGIVSCIGRIVSVKVQGQARRITINCLEQHALWQDLQVSESISVNGVCLTLEALTVENYMQFSVVDESLQRSNLKYLQPGSQVNLERALQANARLGGHWVQGHVDGTARLIAVNDPSGQQVSANTPGAIYHFSCAADLAALLVVKGYISLDGMSLTITAVDDTSFKVCLVPYTLTHSIAHEYQINSVVNLEIDILAKSINRFLHNYLQKKMLARMVTIWPLVNHRRNMMQSNIHPVNNRAFQDVKAALARLDAGGMILLGDAQQREHEYDFVCAAATVSTQQLNMMRQHGSGIICVSLSQERCDHLDLEPMVAAHNNNSSHNTPFTVAVDAASGVSTGVSMSDRQHTIAELVRSDAKPNDFVRPGHIYPLYAAQYGCLQRSGHTEASLDLIQLITPGSNNYGTQPGAVICEAMSPDGAMLRSDTVHKFAQQHDLPIITVQQVEEYCRRYKTQVLESTCCDLVTKYGKFHAHVVRDIYQQEHVMLLSDNIKPGCLVRIHSACFSGDVLSSLHCDCGEQLQYALEQLAQHGGVLLYMQQEGRGIGLFNKIKAYAVQQDQGIDTYAANRKLGFADDMRNYALCAELLRTLGLEYITLLTHNPQKAQQLNKYGVTVKSTAPIPVVPNPFNQSYLLCKQNQRGHTTEYSNELKVSEHCALEARHD